MRRVIDRIWTSYRKQAVAIAGIVGVLAIAAASLLIWAAPGRASEPSSSPASSLVATASARPSIALSAGAPTASVEPSPTGLPTGWAYSDLDGVPAPADLAHRLPAALMIDNYVEARPQSGFSSASIVYQAMIDDSSDRYMMVFQEGSAPDIGPVRSARPYFVYWAAEYKALFGHFGGDAEALQVVIPAMSASIYNEDDLNGGSCPYHRIDTRYAPYNAYTNSAALVSCEAASAFPAIYQGLPVRTFVDDRPAAARPVSQSITIPYLSETIAYKYDPPTDSYLRMLNGKIQVDPSTFALVTARNVVVMYQAYSVEPSIDKLRPVVANVGAGKAVVFEEGLAITGTWKKDAKTSLTRLYDDAGNEIPFVRGQIYIQSVPLDTAVTYG